MESKNLAAIIDLLGPEEFEDFRNTIRAELDRTLQETVEREIAKKGGLAEALTEKKRLEEENERLLKKVQSYRSSIAKLETHIRRVLVYYNIPLEKLEKETSPPEEALTVTPPPPTTPAAPPVTVPPIPPSVSQFPPTVIETLHRFRRKRKNGPEDEDRPSKEEKEEVLRKIEEALREAPVHKRGLTVQDIYLYLEAAKLPVTAPRWQRRNTQRQSRIRTTIYNHLYELRLAGYLGKKEKYWFWIKKK